MRLQVFVSIKCIDFVLQLMKGQIIYVYIYIFPQYFGWVLMAAYRSSALVVPVSHLPHDHIKLLWYTEQGPNTCFVS